MLMLRLFVVVACAASCCVAQHSAADDLHSMLNHLVQNTGSEVQSLSYCRISTRDLMSTAQSTASRVLQGVCNPSELEDRFASLERQVVEQFEALKTMVQALEEQLRGQDQQMKKSHGKLRKALKALRSSSAGGGYEHPTDYLEEDYELDYSHQEQQETPSSSPRQEEISHFNSTIWQEVDGKRVFTYYWKVSDIEFKMNNWGWRRSLRSNSFYVFQRGYRMYLRIYPNQRGQNLYIHVGLTQGEYDSNLDWPFRLKLQVQVLDHLSVPEDLTSRLWDPTQLCSAWHWRRPDSGDNYECVGLGFAKETLRTRGYITDDAIVMKLTVFLT